MNLIGKALRWLLVPLSAIGVVALAIGAGRGIVLWADRHCPAQDLVAGSCVSPWHTSVVEAAIYLGLVAATLGLVIVPSRLAPGLKRTVAVTGLAMPLAGLLFAWQVTRWPQFLVPLAVATACGAVALSWVCSRRPLS